MHKEARTIRYNKRIPLEFTRKGTTFSAIHLTSSMA